MKRIDKNLLRAMGMDEEGSELYYRVWASEIKYLGTDVGVRKIQDPHTGRLFLAIVLDSETRKDNIIKALDDIFAERYRLVKKQGPDLIAFLDYLLQLYRNNQYCIIEKDPDTREGMPSLSKMVYRDATPREIMWDINFDVLVFSMGYSKRDRDRSEDGKNLFYRWLQLMNFGDYSDISDLYNASKAVLKDGYCPWDIDGFPVIKDKVENKLEKLVAKYGDKPRIPSSKPTMLRLYGYFLVRSDWTSAMDLLEKNYRETYEKYKPRFDARTSEILEKQNTDSQFPMQDWPEEQ